MKIIDNNKDKLLKECLTFLSELGHFKLIDLKRVEEINSKIKELLS